MDSLTFLPLLCLLGALAGLMAGLFGIGGGLVTVPGLYLFLSFIGVSPSTAMSLAVGSSLAAIVPTSISSLNAHRNLGNVDWQSARLVVLPLVGGVIIGSQLIIAMDGRALALLFACMSWAIAWKVSLAPQPKPSKWFANAWVKGVSAALIGLVSVMAGVGGGAFAAPLFMAGGLSVHRAVGTASFFGICISLPGVVSLLIAGETPADAPAGTLSLFYLPGLAAVALLATLFAPVGARLGKRLSELSLRRFFAVFLVLVGLRMFWTALSG